MLRENWSNSRINARRRRGLDSQAAQLALLGDLRQLAIALADQLIGLRRELGASGSPNHRRECCCTCAAAYRARPEPEQQKVLGQLGWPIMAHSHRLSR